MGVTQNWDGPDIINFILHDDATRKNDRGPLHRQEDVVVLRLPDPRRHDRRRRSPTPSSTADLSIAELVRAIFNHPAFLSDTAKQGLVRSPVEWVVACMRAAALIGRRRQPAVVDGGHGPAALRAAQRLGLASERVLADDVAAVDACELDALPHLAEQRRGNTLNAITTMNVHDAVQYGFDLLGIDSPSSHTRSNLEAWLTAAARRSHTRGPTGRSSTC